MFVRTSDLEGEGFLLRVDIMIKTRTMLFLSSGAETTNHMLHDLSQKNTIRTWQSQPHGLN